HKVDCHLEAIVRLILLGVIKNYCCHLLIFKLISLHLLAYIDKNTTKLL
ncbi:hypothetical protein TSAR_004623, partial [Trichomalopsis sarcophagae]